MKSYLVTTLAFAVATASSPLWAEIQQRQLTKEIMLQFEEMNQKGDESKEEYVIKNPHFFWMDSSSTAPTILGEVDLKGTLKVIADYKGNNIKTESDGITHIIARSSDPEVEPMNLFIAGKINKSIDIDFKKVEVPIVQLRAGHSSNQTILTILEAISKASAVGENLKITGDGLATDRDPIMIELAKATYDHTSGATPEEFALNVKSNHSTVYVSPTATYRLPTTGKMDSSYDMKAKLPAWSKLLEFGNSPNKTGFPEAAFSGKMSTKSKLGTGTGDWSLTSKKLESNRYLIEAKFTAGNNTSADWVKEFQGIIREPIANSSNNEENQGAAAIEKMVFDWTKSPKTTPFLSLFPLQSNVDWNGSMEYLVDAGNFSFDKGKMNLSVLGNRKTGILLNMDYKGGGEATTDLTLVGGRPLFDHGIALYNTFGDSIASYWRVPRITTEDKNELYNLLTKYSEQPAKANTELKLAVKYNKDGVMIGGKDASDFVNDLTELYKNYMARQGAGARPVGQDQSSDQGFGSYGIQPPQSGAGSYQQPSSVQDSGSQAWPQGQGAGSQGQRANQPAWPSGQGSNQQAWPSGQNAGSQGWPSGQGANSSGQQPSGFRN